MNKIVIKHSDVMGTVFFIVRYKCKILPVINVSTGLDPAGSVITHGPEKVLWQCCINHIIETNKHTKSVEMGCGF